MWFNLKYCTDNGNVPNWENMKLIMEHIDLFHQKVLHSKNTNCLQKTNFLVNMLDTRIIDKSVTIEDNCAREIIDTLKRMNDLHQQTYGDNILPLFQTKSDMSSMIGRVMHQIRFINCMYWGSKSSRHFLQNLGIYSKLVGENVTNIHAFVPNEETVHVYMDKELLDNSPLDKNDRYILVNEKSLLLENCTY